MLFFVLSTVILYVKVMVKNDKIILLKFGIFYKINCIWEKNKLYCGMGCKCKHLPQWILLKD